MQSFIGLHQYTKSHLKSTTKAGLILVITLTLLFSPKYLAMAQSTGGNTYYVSTTGSDSFPGTQSQPWKTIQKAADSMTAGDTLIVQSGTYAEQRVNITISGSSNKYITYHANGTVVMKGFNLQANFIIIESFEISNTSYVRWRTDISSGVYLHGSNNIIENNYIHDNALNGITVYAPSTKPSDSANNLISNNRVYHNEMVGIEVNGENNAVVNNDIWGTIQCSPALMAVENDATDNPSHLSCPDYPAVSGLDADGIRFFGQGHTFQGNHIHDILYGPLGLNPSEGDFNDNPHIDCFQTWSDSNHAVAQNIVFEQNICENLQSQDANENGHGFMLSGGANNLTIRNNIIKAYGGINTDGTGNANHLVVYNNLWINNLSFTQFWPFAIDLQNATDSVVENNIFYNQPYHTIFAVGDTTGQVIDYNLAFNNNGTVPDCFRTGNYDCMIPQPSHDLWNVNPFFVDATKNNFHLTQASPCIDAGAPVQVVNDLENDPRPEGSGFDIGPYEFVFTLQPTSTLTATPNKTATRVQPSQTPTLTETHQSQEATATQTPTTLPSTTPIPSTTPTLISTSNECPDCSPANSGWPMLRDNTANDAHSSNNGPSNPMGRWQFTNGAAQNSSPVIDQAGNLYVGLDSSLIALSNKGNLLWSYSTGGLVAAPLITSGNTIYFGSGDGKLYSLTTNGNLKWSYQTTGPITASPNIALDGTLYIPSNDGKLYALTPAGKTKWTYATGSAIFSTVAVAADGSIFLGAVNGKLYAFHPDGSLSWSFQTGGSITTSPSVYPDGTVYTGSSDGRLYSITSRGKKKWSYLVGGTITSPAVAIDGTIYVGSSKGGLYALSPKGSLNWTFEISTGISAPITDQIGRIYFGNQYGDIYAISSNGSFLWKYQTHAPGYTDTAIGSSETLIACGNGVIYLITNKAGTIRTNYTVYLPGILNSAH